MKLSKFGIFTFNFSNLREARTRKERRNVGWFLAGKPAALAAGRRALRAAMKRSAVLLLLIGTCAEQDLSFSQGRARAASSARRRDERPPHLAGVVPIPRESPSDGAEGPAMPRRARRRGSRETLMASVALVTFKLGTDLLHRGGGGEGRTPAARAEPEAAAPAEDEREAAGIAWPTLTLHMPRGALGPTVALAGYFLPFMVAREVFPQLQVAILGGADGRWQRFLRGADVLVAALSLPAAGAAADAIGRRPVMALSAFGLGVGLASNALARGPVALVVAAIVTGCTKAMATVAALAVLQANGLTRDFIGRTPLRACCRPVEAAAALSFLEAASRCAALLLRDPLLAALMPEAGMSEADSARAIFLRSGLLCFGVTLGIATSTVGGAAESAHLPPSLRSCWGRATRLCQAVAALRWHQVSPVSRCYRPLARRMREDADARAAFLAAASMRAACALVSSSCTARSCDTIPEMFHGIAALAAPVALLQRGVSLQGAVQVGAALVVAGMLLGGRGLLVAEAASCAAGASASTLFLLALRAGAGRQGAVPGGPREAQPGLGAAFAALGAANLAVTFAIETLLHSGYLRGSASPLAAGLAVGALALARGLRRPGLGAANA